MSNDILKIDWIEAEKLNSLLDDIRRLKESLDFDLREIERKKNVLKELEDEAIKLMDKMQKE